MAKVANDEPAIRAAAARDYLSFLDRFSQGLQKKVRAALPVEIEHRIDDSSLLAWISMRENLVLLDIVNTQLGPARFSESIAGFITSFSRSRFLRVLLDASGLTPAGIIRTLSKAWPFIFRNCGSLNLNHLTKSTAQIELLNVPHLLIDAATYPEYLLGMFKGVYQITDYRGDVVIAEIDREGRRIELLLHWEPGAE